MGMDQQASSDAYAVLCRHDRENSAEKRVRRAAEPIICRLKNGENPLKTSDFLAVCRYFFPANKRGPIVRAGRFSIGSIICVRSGS